MSSADNLLQTVWTHQNVGPDLDPNCLTLQVCIQKNEKDKNALKCALKCACMWPTLLCCLLWLQCPMTFLSHFHRRHRCKSCRMEKLINDILNAFHKMIIKSNLFRILPLFISCILFIHAGSSKCTPSKLFTWQSKSLLVNNSANQITEWKMEATAPFVKASVRRPCEKQGNL